MLDFHLYTLAKFLYNIQKINPHSMVFLSNLVYEVRTILQLEFGSSKKLLSTIYFHSVGQNKKSF